MSKYKYGNRITFTPTSHHEMELKKLQEMKGFTSLGDTAKYVVVLAIRGELTKKDGTNLFTE